LTPEVAQRIQLAAKPYRAANGKWRSPLISARKLADIKKAYQRAGIEWPVRF
jgi:hypothetical protein